MRKPRMTLATLVPRDVMGALSVLGIDAEQHGDEATALCPHPDHDDTSPSWSCNLDTGEHHCFACGFGGSFQLLVRRMKGIDQSRAELWIRERKVQDVAAGHIGPRPAPIRPETGVSEADLWRFTPPPQSALDGRGLTAEACQAYEIKWEPTRELWITPVRDPYTGKLWGWQEKNERVFRNRPKDVEKSKALLGIRECVPGGTVLLVESPLDVPYVAVACGPDVYPVSSYGATVSAEQVRLICARAGRVVLAMDNDNAGWKSAAALAFAMGTLPVAAFAYSTVHAAGPVHIVGEPDGRDPGNLTMDEIAWGIEHAVPAWRLRIPWL